MSRLGQRLLWTSILVVIVLWLVLTYMPAALLPLPEVSIAAESPVLAYLGLAALVIFAAIQVWLGWTTIRTVRRYEPARDEAAPARPNLVAEFIWTTLPILITLGLAWVGYGLWRNLFGG